MESRPQIDDTGRTRALAGWALTLVLAVAAVESLRSRALLWGGFLGVCVATTMFPAVVTGDWQATVPVSILVVIVLAALVRATGAYVEIAGYVALASLATLVVVELDAFTAVEMTRRFAIVFGVLTTMAIQGWWTVGQFYSDRWLGTDFITTQPELQVDFVAVSIVAFAIGGLSEWCLGVASSTGSEEKAPG